MRAGSKGLIYPMWAATVSPVGGLRVFALLSGQPLGSNILSTGQKQVLICLGHSSYRGANARRLCFSKEQAIRVLRNRGMKRDDARTALKREFSERSRRGHINLDQFNAVEVCIYVNQLPYGWLGTYGDVKKQWAGAPEL